MLSRRNTVEPAMQKPGQHERTATRQGHRSRSSASATPISARPWRARSFTSVTDGELIQIDGSNHRWFEYRAAACTLLVFIDDATSRLMALNLTATESTISYFEAVDKYLGAHGKPVALYSDKASVFYVKNRSATAGKGVTQFGRALYQLDIEAFCANTRQAKMRVERANLTLQDRLVKELRLREISTWEAANAYAPSSIADFNRRFAKPPAGDHNAHRPVRDDEDLRQILAYRVPRKVTNALTVQYDRVMYLLQDTAPNRKLIHQYVEVVELAESSCCSGGRSGRRCISLWWRSASNARSGYSTAGQPDRARLRLRACEPCGALDEAHARGDAKGGGTKRAEEITLRHRYRGFAATRALRPSSW